MGATFCDDYWSIGVIGDDQVPRTRYWDRRLRYALEALATGIVYADDLFKRERHPTGVLITSDLVRTLGFVAPRCLHHMYADDFWKRLGTDLKRFEYVSEVVIEHLHPVCGKAPMDDSYTESGGWMARDGEAFARYIQEDYSADLAKCQQLIGM